MKPIPWRVQLGVVTAGYVAVILVAAALLFMRHMQYVNHPVDAMAAGGMWAGGDLILGVLIVGLFLMPTFLLVLVIRKSETAYTWYSRILLCLSFTAPISLVFLIPVVNQVNGSLGEFSLYRLFASPFIIVGMVVSRLLARFDRAKRLTLYALLVEAGTVVLLVGLFVFATSGIRR